MHKKSFVMAQRKLSLERGNREEKSSSKPEGENSDWEDQGSSKE